MPDACFGDAGEGLDQQGKGFVTRQRFGKQLPDHGPGAVEAEDAVTVAVGKEEALSCLPAAQIRSLPPQCPAVPGTPGGRGSVPAVTGGRYRHWRKVRGQGRGRRQQGGLLGQERRGFVQIIISQDAAGQGIQQLRSQSEHLRRTAVRDQETRQHVVHAGGGRSGQEGGTAARRAFQQDHGIGAVALPPGRQAVGRGAQIAIMTVPYARALGHEAFQGR